MTRKAPPGCERHHRHPRSRKSSYSQKNINEPRNISIVRVGDHRAYHQLFGNMTPPEMAEMLNDTWISPDFYFVAIPRNKKQGHPRRRRYWCETCCAEVLKHLPITKGEDDV